MNNTIIKTKILLMNLLALKFDPENYWEWEKKKVTQRFFNMSCTHAHNLTFSISKWE